MPEYDGSIIIDSHIDTSNFDKDAGKLFDKAKKLSNIFNRFTSFEIFKDVFKTANNDIRQVSKSFGDINSKIDKSEYKLEAAGKKVEYLKSKLTGLNAIRNDRELANAFGGYSAVISQINTVQNLLWSTQNQYKKMKLEKEMANKIPLLSNDDINKINSAVDATDKLSNRLKNVLESSKDLGDKIIPSDLAKKFEGFSDNAIKKGIKIAEVKNDMIEYANYVEYMKDKMPLAELEPYIAKYEKLQKTFNDLTITSANTKISIKDVKQSTNQLDDVQRALLKVQDTLNNFRSVQIFKASDMEKAKANMLGISDEFSAIEKKIQGSQIYLQEWINKLEILKGTYAKGQMADKDSLEFINKSGLYISEINKITNAIERLQIKKSTLFRGAEINSLNSASKGFEKISEEASKSNKEISKLNNTAKKSGSAFAGLGAVISNSFSGINSMFSNVFSGISRMFNTITRRAQWILLGQTIRAVIADAKESIEDLRIYNQDFDRSMQSIRDSLKNVGNAIATSFAPMLQALAPIIANLARWITELFNKITLFTTALFTGSRAAVIADTSFSGYSKSAKKAAANTKKGTKEIKEQTKALAKFDKLDVFKQDKSRSPSSGIASAAEEIPQAMRMFKTMEVPKGVSDFANKLKQTLAPLANEFKIIGDSFQKNFVAPVYKHIKENILPRFLDSTRERIANMDFSKLNNSLNEFFSVMSDITIQLFDGLEWGWENVLLPMIDKTITEYLPRFLEAVTKALRILNIVWKTASPYLRTLVIWLQELADPIITGFLDGLNEALSRLKWIITLISPPIERLGHALEGIHIPEGLKTIMYYLGKDGFGNLMWSMFPTLRNVKFLKDVYTNRIGTGLNIARWLNIPGFASGTVVSPNNRFLAMLGDNSSEPEVVSPISTMKQAFMEAMLETGMNNNSGNVTLQLDGTTFARLINPYTKAEQNRIGISMIEGVAY